MSDWNSLKQEIIYIKDSLEGGARKETRTNGSPLDKVRCCQTSTSVSGQTENTPEHSGAASMETTANKHRGISQQWGHDSSGSAEIGSGFSIVKPPGLDRSAHVFPTLACSRESIVSEKLDRDKCWPALPLSSVTSPTSLSRTVSPCSSVFSGIFCPSVVQVRKHALAPGSSLVHIPQSCFSSCDSLASANPQSPPTRHRLPLTRLSLLTAILRKGRLPVLSASLRRPYTPCWPVNPVTLTFCNACSAASSVASIPLEFSSPFSSSTSLDSQTFAHREPIRPVTAPLPELPNEHSGPHALVKRYSEEIHSRIMPKWEQVVSPPPLKSIELPRHPSPQLRSKLKSVPFNQKEVRQQHSYMFKPFELKPTSTQMYPGNKEEHNLEKQITPPTLFYQPTTSHLEKSHQPNSSLLKLRWLSEQLRSPSPCTHFLSPSHSRSTSAATSPLPSLTVRRCKSPQGLLKSSNLTQSCYTPVTFPGWSSPISSPTPTPSPATLFRDLTPSPSFSLRSTPSPRPGSGISDCTGREDKKRKPHKIKSSYKSLAAIPTNTLLLDQQVIDEQVESENILKRGVTSDGADEDTHAEMCSPAQLRQQSEELYAAIDEILANSTPPSKSSSKTWIAGDSLRNKSLGRETKYASLSSWHQSTRNDRRLMESKKTNPGIIRPMNTISRLPEKAGEEYRHHPVIETEFHHYCKGNNNSSKMDRVGLEDMGINGHSSRKSKALRGGRTSERSPFAVCELQIIEPEGPITHFEEDSSNSLCSDACETHI
ncbi:muscular LMNA-interacting protein [Corythoichthys intestinalis]|uniref:muscular LMNA-interacting protein n=1 Tax=Corythoichthys intestinalis TaxID=161448 RepID=UPI0025A4DDA3|nr:muscular LMNA-interacting protein [Corythoichthys intestinalis]